MGLGTKIKKIRELKNFSQEYMATRLEMSPSGYSRIERDEVSIAYDKVEKIAELLQISMSTLVEFDEKIILQGNHISGTYYNAVNFGNLTIGTDLVQRIEELEKTIQELKENQKEV